MRPATKREGRASVFDFSWECWATQIFATMHVSVIILKNDFGATSKQQQGDKFMNMELTSNEDILNLKERPENGYNLNF